MTNESCKVVAENCPELRVFRSPDALSLTDPAIEFLAKGCRKLERVLIASAKLAVPKISSNSLLKLVQNCGNLQYLGKLHSRDKKDVADVAPNVQVV